MFASRLPVRIALLAIGALLLWALFAGETGAVVLGGGAELADAAVEVAEVEVGVRVVGGRGQGKPGDTLWSIAERSFAGDPREGVWELRERNELESAVIVPGQVLVLPS